MPTPCRCLWGVGRGRTWSGSRGRCGCVHARTAEYQQRGWAGKHADHQHGGYPDQIVDLEVVDVLTHARGGLREACERGARIRGASCHTSAKLSGLAYAVLSSSSAHGRRCAAETSASGEAGAAARFAAVSCLRQHLRAHILDACQCDAHGCVGRASATSARATRLSTH